MNKNTMTKLGFESIREELLKHISSQLGQRLVMAMAPMTDRRKIERSLDETVEAILVLEALNQPPLYGLHDISAYLERIRMGSVLQPGELMLVADVLRGMRLTRQHLERFEHQATILSRYAAALGQFKALEEEIHEAIQGDWVRSSASKALGAIRRQQDIIENRIETRMKKMLSSKTYLPYIQDPVIQQRDGFHVIPVKASHRQMVPGRVIAHSATGATVFICPETVEKLTAQMRELKVAEEAEVYQVLALLTGLVHEELEAIDRSLEILADLDFIFTRARFSQTYGGTRPQYEPAETVDLKAAFHPLLDAPVKNDLLLGEGYRGLLVTGPNTGGKTMALKTVGLNILLAQCGILPACGPGSRLSVFRAVYVDMGDDQDLSQSLSTFSAHIANLKGIVGGAGRATICLVDEIGTGTDPREGAALGIAILTRLYDAGCLVMGTSHYGELKEFAQRHPDFMNASMTFNEATLSPTYRIVYDAFGESNGIPIARRLEMDEAVIRLAERILASEDPHALYAALPARTFRTRRKRQEAVVECPYRQGDQVLDRESGRRGIFHSAEKIQPFAKVLFGETFERVALRRLERTFTREQLYPEGYDLEQLFVPFRERKMDRDLSKKRLYRQKDIQKILKSTQR